MPPNNDQEIKIRVSAADEGVARVMRQIRDEVSSTTDQIRKSSAEMFGPVKPPRFQFNDQLVRDETARALRVLRQEAEREKIRLEAQVIVRRRNDELIGPGTTTDDELGKEARDRFRATKRPDDAGRGGGGETEGLRAFFQARQILRVAEIIASVPKVIEGYKAAVQTGENSFAALGKAVAESVPFIGEFVKAGQAIRQVAEDYGFNVQGRIKEEEAKRQQEDREARQGIKDRVNAKRGEVNAEADAAAREAGKSDYLRGATGDVLAARQADLELAAKKEQANALRQKAGTFSKTEDQDRIRKEADALEQAAIADHRQKLYELQIAADNRELAAQNAHKEAMAQSAADQQEAILEEQGKGAAARIVAIQETNRKELLEARKKRDAEINDLQQNLVASSDPRYKAAQQRYDEAARSSNAKASAERERTLKQDADEKEKRNTEVNNKLDEAAGRVKVQQLAAEAAEGSKVAEVEQRRAQIAEEHRKTREQLLEIIKDQSATEEQRKRALELNDQDVDQEQKDLLRAGRSGGRSIGAISAGDTRSQSFTGASLIEKRTDPIVIALDDQAKKQLENAKAVAKTFFASSDFKQVIADVFSNIPGVAALFTPGGYRALTTTMPAGPLATQIWSAYRIARGRDATRAWLVTGVTTADQAIATAGISEGNTHSEDARLRIGKGGITVDKQAGPFTYKVTGQYGTSQVTGGGNNPLDEPPIIFPQPIDEQEAIDVDRYGTPITNSALIPYTGITRPAGSLSITIRRNYSTFDVALSLAYRKRLNLEPVTIAKVGTLQAKQLLCVGVYVAEGFPTNADYVSVITHFEARPYYQLSGNRFVTGFARRLPDIGREGFSYGQAADGSGQVSKTGEILYRSGMTAGQAVQKEVFLNGKGVPLDDEAYAVGLITAPFAPQPSLPETVIVDTSDKGTFLYYEIHDEISFNGLNVPAI